MIKLNKIILTLVGILILAIFFRFYQLSSVPPSASLDEVSIGWNAYSILQTGKDEYGNTFPILLRAYDDWRPALYVYFVIPFIKLFELNVLSVRLPSVIFSVLTIFATYLLVKELFKNQKIINSEHIALLCAFLLAISPWHIYISRLGHEVNLGLSFAIFAVLFTFWRKIYIATFFFILSFISYQTEKIFIPLLLLGIFFIFKSDIIRIKRKILIALLFSIIILTPFIKANLDPNALIRFSATNVFEANKQRFIDQSLLLKKATSENDLIGKVIYNRRVLAFQIFSEGYLSHFNPVWLFTNASEDRHKVPGFGLLYIWELPLILIGLYALVRYKFNTQIKQIIFLWFFTAPLAAALTTDAPHALRSLVFLPTWQIFSALGLVSAYHYFKKENLRKALITLFGLLIFLNLVYFQKQYFSVFPRNQSESFQYSLSQAIPFVHKIENSYEKIFFSNHDKLFQSYMFFLFYSKYDPKLYQEQGGTTSGGFAQTHKIGKYEFRPIKQSTEIVYEKTLFVGNVNEAKAENILQTFSNINGEDVIAVWE